MCVLKMAYTNGFQCKQWLAHHILNANFTFIPSNGYPDTPFQFSM